MGGTARRAATATLVAVAIVVAALALWKLRLVIALLFLGFVIASAMRPSVEWLNRRARVPRSVGVVVHYLGFLAAIALFLYLIVPVAIEDPVRPDREHEQDPDEDLEQRPRHRDRGVEEARAGGQLV